jgi:Domain of unknown function (DUF4186)
MEKKFKRVIPDDIRVEDLTPLNISCGSTKCNEDLHCFSLKKSALRKHNSERVCYQCGTDLIEWDRIHKNDIKDAKFIFKSMKNELIRHVFWHTPIEENAIEFAQSRGKIELRIKASKLLKARIGKHNAFVDGRQTPLTGKEIISYAQHATATCCRKCLEAWHNIPQNRLLSDEQIEFCTNLVMLYISERVPNLKDKGVEVMTQLKK